MKNKEIISAGLGGAFFALPYLVLSVPILPSVAIATTAFVASELILNTKDFVTLKDTNVNLYKTLEQAKKDNNHILEMIKKIDNNDLKDTLKSINTTVNKIISAVEKDNNSIRKINNFFDYYLPVTNKLVDRYDKIENVDLKSKDSIKFYKNTLDTLNEINTVFKKFLEKIYQDDMTDTKVEIKVLNTMLKTDGLTKDSIKVGEKDE